MATLLGKIIYKRCPCVIEKDIADEAQREHADKQRKLDELFKASNLGERFKASTFQNWIRQPNDALYDRCKVFADKFPTQEGIALYGSPGNGKSHLAAAIVHELVGKGYSAIFQSVPMLLAEIRNTYNGQGSEYRLMNALMTADIIVLDDVGANKNSEFAETTLYQIVSVRYNNRKPIIITTNVRDFKDLEPVIGERTYSRLCEMCTPMPNALPDFRKQIAKERMR